MAYSTGDVFITDKTTKTPANVNSSGQLDVSSSGYGVPSSYSKQTASGETWLIQKGQLNKMRLRPQIMNEHAESSRNIQGVVTSTNIVGQFFKASQDNINGAALTLESAAGIVFDNFESYTDDATLRAAWVATGDNADLESSTVYEGSQAMSMPCAGAGQVGKTWKKNAGGADFTGHTGEFQMYSNKEYKDVKLKVFVEDSSGNVASREIVQSDKNVWTKVVVPTDSLVDEGAATDMTDIDYIGYKIEKEKRDGYVIVDILTSVPPPGEVSLKLWNMGSTLPGSVSLDSGTQYEKLGDLGITGVQEASVALGLLGGKRMYHVNNFVAGVSLEIPTNELLIPDNYYALTIHYVDTDVSVYGPNEAWDNYYNNGYGFTAPNESTAITAMGTNKDIQFVIFSTQDVYINEISQFTDAAPSSESLTTIYVEDKNMIRTDVLISGIQSLQTAVKEISRPFFMEKGAKFEEEYSDDFTDSVSSVNVIIQYYFIPPTVNG